eukprot:TRINITY_DN12487_c0_g1_i1.p1 TRINITY_DN12487_c0_g1~~TRINITY_DN12487_c0_g1_i1.p1  ORF type:complete len:818 (+),score=177.56 TRINITY_DN12487_c0_g1_i1:176-2629(+)
MLAQRPMPPVMAVASEPLPGLALEDFDAPPPALPSLPSPKEATACRQVLSEPAQFEAKAIVAEGTQKIEKNSRHVVCRMRSWDLSHWREEAIPLVKELDKQHTRALRLSSSILAALQDFDQGVDQGMVRQVRALESALGMESGDRCLSPQRLTKVGFSASHGSSGTHKKTRKSEVPSNSRCRGEKDEAHRDSADSRSGLKNWRGKLAPGFLQKKEARSVKGFLRSTSTSTQGSDGAAAKEAVEIVPAAEDKVQREWFDKKSAVPNEHRGVSTLEVVPVPVQVAKTSIVPFSRSDDREGASSEDDGDHSEFDDSASSQNSRFDIVGHHGLLGDRKGMRQGITMKKSVYKPTEQYWWQEPVWLVVHNTVFDIFMAFFIVLNTAVIGLEADYQARNNNQSDFTYDMIGLAFTILFSLELALRLIGDGEHFFQVSEDLKWNCFDSFMVGCSLIEIIVQYATPAGGEGSGGLAGTGRVLRVLRVLRLARIMRIGRLLRYASSFRQMSYSIQASLPTLISAVFLIFLVIYVFAICFLQGVTQHLVDMEDSSAADAEEQAVLLELHEQYRNLPSATYGLYLSFTGGRNWGEVLHPLLCLHWFYPTMFLVFITFTIFGVLNVVTAIFVDSAMSSQQHFKELLVQEQTHQKELYLSHLRGVFQQIDEDKSGHISFKELEFCLASPTLNEYMESIGIYPNDARTLFDLLDQDDSDSVSIEEFCNGCLRLKGEAKSFDVHCIKYTTERMLTKMNQLERDMKAFAHKERQSLHHSSRASEGGARQHLPRGKTTTTLQCESEAALTSRAMASRTIGSVVSGSSTPAEHSN